MRHLGKIFGDVDGGCGCQDKVEVGEVALFGSLCQKCDPNIGDEHIVYVLLELWRRGNDLERESFVGAEMMHMPECTCLLFRTH